ncbi:MAG: hypothetical protein ACI9TY_000989 [Alphaproteobacteria bacterium]|jgi:hypothetical protein
MSSNKNTALAEIKSIIDENNISKNDVMSIFNQASTSVWMQILAFVAGLFLVGGLTLAASQFWDDMSQVQQIIITLGAGLSSFTVAMFFARGEGYKDSKALIVSLLLIPVFLEPLGAGVTFYHYFGDQYMAENMIRLIQASLAIMAIQYLIAGYGYKDIQMLLPIGLIFAAVLATITFGGDSHLHGVFEVSRDFVTLAIAASLLLASFFIEKMRGYNSWMVLTYVPSVVAFIVIATELLSASYQSEAVAASIAFILSLGFMFLGNLFGRKSVLWPATAIAIGSFIVFILDVIVMSVGTLLFIAVLGALALYLLHYKNKAERLENSESS